MKKSRPIDRVRAVLEEIKAEANEYVAEHPSDDEGEPNYASGLLSAVHDIELVLPRSRKMLRRAPREVPLLFSSAMVRALLDGSKTQTRRIIGLPEMKKSPTPGYDWTWRGLSPIRTIAQQIKNPHGCWQDVSNDELLRLAPIAAGDTIWVKETFRVNGWDDADFATLEYLADHTVVVRSIMTENIDEWHEKNIHRLRRQGYVDQPDGNIRHPEGKKPSWRPSIYMERWMSRIELEVTEVRAERLQDITNEDAIAEGIGALGKVSDPRGAYCALWDSINGDRASWEENPIVWVYSFRRV